jgi:hypothetical protein
MSWGQTGVGIGKVWEQGSLDVQGESYINGNKIWHQGNDGSGSGLDADLLEGIHATGFTRAYSSGYSFGGNQNAITTAQFITLLTNLGAFNQTHWVSRGSWSYAGNQYINDTGCGNIHLAGCVVEVFGDVYNGYTIRIITPTTSASGVINSEFVYVNNGSGYSPSWRKMWNSANDGSGSGLDADLLDGMDSSAFSKKSTSTNITLLTATWSGSSAPYSYTVTVTGVTATNNIELVPQSSLTTAQATALANAQILTGTQTTNSITMKAYGTKPSIDLPITVIIRGD